MVALVLIIVGRLLQLLGTLLLAFQAVILIITHPFTALRKKKRSIPPQCLLDPSLGDHEYVTANGIKFHYVTAGDKAKPLMLLLHGFPEFWYSWRYQLKEFTDDYHVVAVDMRGYGETEKPAGVDKYEIDSLREDVVQLVKVLSSDEKCILVAHDWGGAIAWTVAQENPEVVEKLIVMNAPHRKVFEKVIRKGWTQMLRSWYVFAFQTPWLPEFLFSLRDYKALEEIFQGGKAGPKNIQNFPKDIIEAYKYTFGKEGAFTPPINYYRNLLKPLKKSTKKIEMPTLLIWGEDDVALGIELIEPHKSICENLTIRRIPKCSHWVQQDCPELTNQYMREFLETSDSED